MFCYRYQQPAAPAEAAAGDPGDGVADVSVGAARHGLRRARLRGHEPRVDRERLAALARSLYLTLLISNWYKIYDIQFVV